MPDQIYLDYRAERPYLGIPVFTSLNQEAQVIARHLAELREWMRSRQIAETGPPFVRYRMTDMPDRMEIDVCLPVKSAPPGDGRVRGNALPAGQYAVLVHTGPQAGLVAANEKMQRWAAQQGIRFQTRESEDATDWTSRLETYLIDAQSEPDARKHQTEIAYLVKA
jgi:effector-binding domain-containing protein